MKIAISKVGTGRIFIQSVAQARQFYVGILGLPRRIDSEVFSAFRIALVDRLLEKFSEIQVRIQVLFANWLVVLSEAVGGNPGMVAPFRPVCVVIMSGLEKASLEWRVGAYLTYRRQCNYVAGVCSADV